MTRLRKRIGAGDGLRARVHTRLSLLLFVSVGTASTASAVVACGDAEPSDFRSDPTDAAPDAREASLPPDDDAGVELDVDADAAAAPPDYDASDEPVVCATTPCATQLAAGDRHLCALMSDGTVQCWGTDTRGSLGRGESDGGVDAGPRPQRVDGLANVNQISAGAQGNTTCAVDAEKHVWCWGDNSGAQLGLVPSPGFRDFGPHPTPMRAALSAEVVRVDLGQSTACAIATDGKVYCWGGNDSKQLARPDSTEWYEGPGLAELGDHAIEHLVLTQYSSFAVTADGQLLGWGRASGRQSSLSSSEGSAVPVPLPSVEHVTRAATSGFVSGSDGHQCAIARGSVYCWGGNIRGELGTGVPDSEQTPAFAGIITDAGVYPQQLALGPNRSCVRMTNGTLQCCGDDRLGQLGRGGVDAGTFATTFGPAVALTGRAVQIVASRIATCALMQDGGVMCWGGNTNGELGQGTTDSLPHPTPVKVVFPVVFP